MMFKLEYYGQVSEDERFGKTQTEKP